MSEVENARARAEAVRESSQGRALRSARRAQLWAGLNRYLASEAQHAHAAAERDRSREKEEGEAETEQDRT